MLFFFFFFKQVFEHLLCADTLVSTGQRDVSIPLPVLVLSVHGFLATFPLLTCRDVKNYRSCPGPDLQLVLGHLPTEICCPKWYALATCDHACLKCG